MRLTTCITSLHFYQNQAQVTTPNKSSQVVWLYTSGVSAGVEISRADSHRPAHRPPRAQGRLLLIWNSSRLQQHFKCRGRPFLGLFLLTFMEERARKVSIIQPSEGARKVSTLQPSEGVRKVYTIQPSEGARKVYTIQPSEGARKVYTIQLSEAARKVYTIQPQSSLQI